MNEVLKKLGLMGLIPVVVIDDAEHSLDAAQALMNAGLYNMEITLRTEAGLEAIKRVKSRYSEMVVGAGTVISVEKAQMAVDAGAEFIVAPGYDPKVVDWCASRNVPITPGCVTPSEITNALNNGLNVIKFFPANIYGGVKGCKALYEPFRSVKFIPTGGVSLDNLHEYADKHFIHAIGGGFLCSSADIKAQKFDNITSTVKQAIKALLGFEFAHVGINSSDPEKSLSIAGSFADAFGFGVKQGNSSNFAGTAIEVNNSQGLGANGHLAIKTNSISRAVHYLEAKGYKADWNTVKGDKERPIAVYLKDEIGGFAVHLLQK